MCHLVLLNSSSASLQVFEVDAITVLVIMVIGDHAAADEPEDGFSLKCRIF